MIWGSLASSDVIILLSLSVMAINAVMGVVAAYIPKRFFRQLLLAVAPVLPALFVTSALVPSISRLEITEVELIMVAVTAMILVWGASYMLTTFVFRRVYEMDETRVASGLEECKRYVSEAFVPTLCDTVLEIISGAKHGLIHETKEVGNRMNDVLGSINRAEHNIVSSTDRMERAASTAVQETKSMSDRISKNLAKNNELLDSTSRLLGSMNTTRAQMNTVIGNQETMLEILENIVSILPKALKDNDKASPDNAKDSTKDHKYKIKTHMATLKLDLSLSSEMGFPDMLSKTVDDKSYLAAVMVIKQLSLSPDGTRQRRTNKRDVIKQWEFARESQVPLAFHTTNSENGRRELYVVPADELWEWDHYTTSTKLISDDQGMIDDLKYDYDKAIEELGGKL